MVLASTVFVCVTKAFVSLSYKKDGNQLTRLCYKNVSIIRITFFLVNLRDIFFTLLPLIFHLSLFIRGIATGCCGVSVTNYLNFLNRSFNSFYYSFKNQFKFRSYITMFLGRNSLGFMHQTLFAICTRMFQNTQTKFSLFL